MWKYLNESVEGTSHLQTGLPCQDASFVSPFGADGEDLLILACADGAGSASEAQVGATLACKSITNCVTGFLETGRSLAEVGKDTVHDWIIASRGALDAEAVTRGIRIRELACTLLLAVLGKSGAIFVQIGDGAMVKLADDEYRPIFWPQSGEYQNTTFFLTDDGSHERALFSLSQEPIDELAMFTDGLQMLALNFATKTAHAPFFSPLFKTLRSTDDFHELIIPLRQFLTSPGVNNRTDDDKTLILATRVQRGDAGV